MTTQYGIKNNIVEIWSKFNMAACSWWLLTSRFNTGHLGGQRHTRLPVAAMERPGFPRPAGISRQIPVFARSRLDQLLPTLQTAVYVITSVVCFPQVRHVASTGPVDCSGRWGLTAGHSCSVSDIVGLQLINTSFRKLKSQSSHMINNFHWAKLYGELVV